MNSLITFAMIGIIYIVNGAVKYYRTDDDRKKKKILISLIVVSIAFSANYIDIGCVLLSKINIVDLPTHSGYVTRMSQGKKLGAPVYVTISGKKFGMTEIGAVKMSFKKNKKYVVEYTPITKTVVNIHKEDGGLW